MTADQAKRRELRKKLLELDKMVGVRIMREPTANDSYIVDARLRLTEAFTDELLHLFDAYLATEKRQEKGAPGNLREHLIENTKWLIQDSYGVGFDNGEGSREPLHEDSKLKDHMELVDAYLAADRERIEVEARLDELGRMPTRVMDDPDDDTNIFWYRTYTMPEFNGRIAELERRKEATRSPLDD